MGRTSHFKVVNLSIKQEMDVPTFVTRLKDHDGSMSPRRAVVSIRDGSVNAKGEPNETNVAYLLENDEIESQAGFLVTARESVRESNPE